MGAALRVLLVEDDEEDYLLTRKLLKGFEVSWAPSYDRALKELPGAYGACLVDYQLGARSGLALIEQAIADGFRGPLILLTGHDNHGLDVEAMKSGASDYLVKGQTTPQLMERVIRHSVDRKAAEAVLRDTEEQLRQSQKLEAIGALAGGIAHDFNNLLSVILGYSELLTEGLAEDDLLRVDLAAIHEAGLRAAELTRQLLAFSRKQVLKPRILDISAVFSGMENMLRRLIGEDVELSSSLAAKLPSIMADSGQIEQVIMNLVVNARDAMPLGGRLTVETAAVFLDQAYAAQHLHVTPGPHVMLAVSDSGVGMDRATQARLFEPFFTTKVVGKGTGLGLATVFGIVRQSGGTIWVYSELGVGTTFKVYFPALEGAPATISRPPLALDALRGSETVLLVEDDDRVRVLTHAILSRYGYEVLEASTGDEALLLSAEHEAAIHLLLTDVVMLRMSGRQLAERLVTLRPEMKVLYMSGYTDDAVVRHGVLEARIAFIQKPITPEALARKVREVLGVAGSTSVVT